jgi:hypothetical protein
MLNIDTKLIIRGKVKALNKITLKMGLKFKVSLQYSSLKRPLFPVSIDCNAIAVLHPKMFPAFAFFRTL